MSGELFEVLVSEELPSIKRWAPLFGRSDFKPQLQSRSLQRSLLARTTQYGIRGVRKISSRTTFWYRRVFPVFWFGFLLLWTVFALLLSGNERPPRIIFLIPGVMAIFGYFMIRWLVLPLADEVFLDGDEILVRKNGKKIRFSIRQILNVDSSMMTNPERITLTLREQSELGKEIAFSPTYRWHFFSRHPIAEELIAKSNGLVWKER
jgi:hypothetical protein